MTELYTVRDTETGMAAKVFKNPKGFAVVLRDEDADETASVRIFPKLQDAKDYADTLVQHS